MTPKRILIVGGGFAGMYAAMEMRRLEDAGHQVTLVSAENFMQYQPFLPEVASGTIDPRAIVVPLRPLLKRATIEVGEVTSIDHDARNVGVRIPDGGTVRLDYDVLVVTAGSWSRVLPIPGLAEHGIGFTTVQEAIYLRNHVLSRLDVATQTPDPQLRRAALTFVFVGAGYAGVEALGELEDLARDAMRNYPKLVLPRCGGSWSRRPAGYCLSSAATSRRTRRHGWRSATSTCCCTPGSNPRWRARSGCRTGRRSRPTRWSGQRG